MAAISASAKSLRGRGQSSAVWTREMKSVLCSDIMPGQHVWTAGVQEPKFGEWLVDLVRFDADIGGWGAKLSRIRLAMESEWLKDDKEVLYDFYKLLAVKADYRVMICEVKAGRVKERLELFREAYNGFGPKYPGERMLMACWDDHLGKFEFGVEVTS